MNRDRVPWVFLIGMGGVMLALSAWGEYLDGNWVMFSAFALYAVALLGAAVLLVWPPWPVWPLWVPRFVVRGPRRTAGGHGPEGLSLRCTRCDTMVLPVSTVAGLDRLMISARLHVLNNCEVPAAEPGPPGRAPDSIRGER